MHPIVQIHIIYFLATFCLHHAIPTHTQISFTKRKIVYFFGWLVDWLPFCTRRECISRILLLLFFIFPFAVFLSSIRIVSFFFCYIHQSQAQALSIITVFYCWLNVGNVCIYGPSSKRDIKSLHTATDFAVHTVTTGCPVYDMSKSVPSTIRVVK